MPKHIKFTDNSNNSNHTNLLCKSLRLYATELRSDNRKCALKYNYIPERVPWSVRYIVMTIMNEDYKPPLGYVISSIKSSGVARHINDRVYEYTQR